MSEFLNFYLLPGIVLGSIYALGAIGITLTFGILRFANFAHGECMTLGVYFAWTIVQISGMHPLAATPFAMLLTVLVVVGVDQMFYKPLRQAPVVMLVVASFGLMLMLRSIIQYFWNVQLKSILPGIQLPYVIADVLRIAPKHIMIICGAVALMFAVHFLLQHTKIGKAMRAVADSPELARLTGIDTEKVVLATWVVGGALACAAGVFLAIDTHVETRMGFKLLLPMFAAAILGGVGRPYGALAGGLVIGIAEELSSYPWIGSEPLLNPGYKAGVAFAIMIAMLIWRPSGLFRGKVF
ncbi:MAG: branched-chain amino acid ABC transporter permease [Gammaproteobacteria bacterium]|nr:branched-chain amino acid ABC transporter permease [Gammaproteobacteria bacterium]